MTRKAFAKLVLQILSVLTAIYVIYVGHSAYVMFQVSRALTGSIANWDVLQFFLLLGLNIALLFQLTFRASWSTALTLAVIDICALAINATSAPLLGVAVVVGLFLPGVSDAFQPEE